jgi:hypothetical protein
MIINKKMLERLHLARDKYLLFSYLILKLEFNFLNSFVLGWPLSPAQHLIGRKRDEATRYI